MKRNYPSFDVLRVIFSFLVCVMSFGFPGDSKGYLRVIGGTAALGFFILSGYLVAGHDEGLEERLKHAMKRTAALFGFMAGFYLLVNVVYYWASGRNILVDLKGVRTWVNFIVFNRWPFQVGECIWYIQSLLYGYIALFLLNKAKLLRSGTLIMILCFILTLLTGEFAGTIGFSLFGYDHINASLLTRSLPYLLLGRTLRQVRPGLSKAILGHESDGHPKGLKPWIVVPFLALSVYLTILEYSGLMKAGKLVYSGHMIGNGLLALLLCGWASLYMRAGSHLVRRPRNRYCRLFVKLVYIFHQPIGIFLFLVVDKLNSARSGELVPYLGIITFFILIGIMTFACFVAEHFGDRRPKEDMKHRGVSETPLLPKR